MQGTSARPGVAIHALASVALLSIASPADAELLRRTSFEYDEQGRLVTELHVEPSTGTDVVFARHGYDAEGRRISSTDALGRTTRMSHDELGRVVTVRDAAGGVATFEYNASDRLTRVTDPRGLVTSYQWDGLGNLWQQDSPDTGRTSFGYGPEGLRTTMRRNDGSVTTYAYDGVGRLLQAKAGDAERNFTYGTCENGIGRLCAAVLRENGVVRSAVAHGYTPWGWLTQRRESGIDETGNAYDQMTAYAYNRQGLVTGIAYPSGVGVGYAYSAGRLTAMTATIDGLTRTVASNITHQPFGPVDGWTYGNGLERLAHFDRNGRLFGLGVGAGNTLVQSLTYGFDAAGEISAITHGVDASQSRRFEYDDLGRLSAEPLRGKSWAFDANGNRIRETEAGVTLHHVIDAASNRLIAIHQPNGIRTYGYDHRGNRIAESASGFEAKYRYDGFNRLHEATVNGATSRYTVNALDQRTGKTTPNGSTRFTYAGQNQLMAEHGAAGWTSYLWLSGELVGLVKPDKQLQFVHNDHLGRPEVVTDFAKQAVWRAKNAEYEREVSMDRIGGLSIGFPGQYLDDETGLWQNGYRDGYDDEVGRYLQPDPIGLADGVNPYSYVGGNPIMGVDYLGLFCISPQARDAISGGVGAFAGTLATTANPVAAVVLGGVGAAAGYYLGPGGSGATTGAIAAGASTMTVRGTVIGAVTGGLAGAESSALVGGAMGALEGAANAKRAFNPTGWDAVAGPALKGLRGGVVGWAAGWGAEKLVDFANREFGDCGCGQ